MHAHYIYYLLAIAVSMALAQANEDAIMDSTEKLVIMSQKKLERCHNNNEIYRTHMSQTENHLSEFLTGEKEEKPAFLWIGCSLDRYQIVSVCLLLGGEIERIFPDGAHGDRPAAIVCHATQMTLGYLQIFGMHKKCNGEVADAVDPRHFDTEADHVRALLPELLERMGSIPSHVQVGSNLWDLSPGCNNVPGVSKSFQKLYVQGMHELYEAISEILPADTQVSWRTGMPVHTDYSNMAQGRKLENQEILNRLVEQEVLGGRQGLGSYLDLWSVVRQATRDCCMMKDGRHYPACSSYAFFNNWLDSIYSTGSLGR